MTKRYLTLACAAILMAGPALARDIDMQSVYPGSLPLLGKEGAAIGGRISLLTDGETNLIFKNPGELVSPGEVWDSLSTGAIEAAWYSPGFAEGVVPSAALFTAYPFGPDIRGYTAWWYNGGGYELWNEISEPYNIHSELCSILAPEASGWFKEPIESPEDLKGLKMRIFGLGASVMQKLGVAAQSLSVGDTITGLNTGTLDATEISFPAIDEAIGLYEHAKHYYFPGWHQQTSLIVLAMNKDTWEGLDERSQAAIKEVCTANVALTSAAGEAIQIAPLQKMQTENGVIVHKWNDTMMDAFQSAWDEVVIEKSAESEEFKRVWDHLQAFKVEHDKWKALGYVD